MCVYVPFCLSVCLVPSHLPGFQTLRTEISALPWRANSSLTPHHRLSSPFKDSPRPGSCLLSVPFPHLLPLPEWERGECSLTLEGGRGETFRPSDWAQKVQTLTLRG